MVNILLLGKYWANGWTLREPTTYNYLHPFLAAGVGVPGVCVTPLPFLYLLTRKPHTT